MKTDSKNGLTPVQIAGVKQIVSFISGWCRATNRTLNNVHDAAALQGGVNTLAIPLEMAVKQLKGLKP